MRFIGSNSIFLPGRCSGRAWTLVDEIPDPGLLVRDATGLELRYPLPTAVSGAGFLIEPFIRGEVDFIRRQSGAILPRVSEITHFATAPLWLVVGKPWLLSSFIRCPESPNSPILSSLRKKRWKPIGCSSRACRSASRLIFLSAWFPPEQNDSVLFAHPPSMLEFAVTKEDHRVRGRIGILPGALKGPHPTDGVDFSVEFFGEDGIRQCVISPVA